MNQSGYFRHVFRIERLSGYAVPTGQETAQTLFLPTEPTISVSRPGSESDGDAAVELSGAWMATRGERYLV